MPTGFGTGITVVTKSLPDAVVGAAYDAYTLDALDYTPPISWTIVSGALPAGMSMDSAGVVSGTPTVVGTFTITVEATDAVLDTKQQTLTIRVMPDLGSIRRHQLESVLENGTSVVPIEGAGLADLRRKLERLFARAHGTDINERYMLDAADLQIRDFDSVPVQSLEDALLSLLSAISGFASGLDANGAGAPFVTPGSSDEFNIVGVAPIQVTKDLVGNALEISYSGAALSAPFTMLPAPSGDITGATDTAALVALLAGSTQDWLVSPQDETDDPYYINADLGTFLGTRKYRLTGKNRQSFRIVGVGGLRTWFEVTSAENVSFSDVRIGGSSTEVTAKYRDCRLALSVEAALVDTVVAYAAMDRCHVTIDHAAAALFLAGQQLSLLNCSVERTVSAPSSVLIATDAASATTYLLLNGNFLAIMDGTGVDLTSIHADSTVMLCQNMWAGVGVPIERAGAPALLAGRYTEALQSVSATGNRLVL